MASGSSYLRQPIPIALIVLVAVVIHGPLLLMELPASTSYDANLHMFFASHYASHWFNPWNEKWFAGFSQTTYPPLTHQWIALLSHLVGLTEAFMLVQLVAVILLAVLVFATGELAEPRFYGLMLTFAAAMFVNHSCAPNCETEEDNGRVFIKAIRNIAAGEELVYEYNLHDSDDESADCYCGAPHCRGTMFSDDELKRRARKAKRKAK